MCLLLAVGIDVTTGSLIPANTFSRGFMLDFLPSLVFDEGQLT
jgi:hypothetical protein